MSVAEERLTSRKRSINLMPKSMNEVCVRVQVHMCWFMLLCLVHACMHRCTCSEFLPQCSCSNTYCAAIAIELPIGPCSTKVEQRTGALVGLLRLTSFLLRAERRNASTERSGFFFSCSDGSKNVFGILYSFCLFFIRGPLKSLIKM